MMDNDWGELDKELEKLPLKDAGTFDYEQPIIEPRPLPQQEGSDGR